MARRNDLAGLAALGALGLLLNKKQDGSSVPVLNRGTSSTAAESSSGDAAGSAAEDLGAIYAEDGTRSKLRRNLETGDLYSPDEAITRPAATRRPASSSRASAAPSTSRQPVVGDPGGAYDIAPPERPMVDPERRKNYGMLESIKGYYGGNPFSAASAKREALNALNATAGLSAPGFVGNTTQKQYLASKYLL